MTGPSRLLLRSAFLSLACGLTLGVLFTLDRPLGAALRPMHVELNVWGFVTLMIYGVGLFIVPRFAGRPLRRPRLVRAVAMAAPAGVFLSAAGWLAAWQRMDIARGALLAGGIVQAVAAGGFIVLIGELLLARR